MLRNRLFSRWSLLFPFFIVLLTITASCSVVFTASVTGSVVDSERWNANPDAPEDAVVPNVLVFIYNDQLALNRDIKAFEATELEDPSDALTEYLKKTISDANGEFEINGLLWRSWFSYYGKDGDIRDVYFLLYHHRYGLIESSQKVVSGVTNRLAPVKITDLYNNRTVTGRLYDYETYDPDPVLEEDNDEYAVGNFEVNLWIPDYWEYDADGAVDPATIIFPPDPTASLTCDNTGFFEYETAFRMLPSREENRKSVRIALTFDQTHAYKASTAIATDSSNRLLNDRDMDQDGDIDDADIYFLSPEIADKSTIEQANLAFRLPDLVLINRSNSATVGGRLVDSLDDGVNNVTLRLYIPEYRIDNPDLDADDAGYGQYVFGEEWSATVTTADDEDGEPGYWEYALDFPKLPTEENDNGSIGLLLAVDDADWEGLPASDSRFIDAGADGALAAELESVFGGEYSLSADFLSGENENSKKSFYVIPAIVRDTEENSTPQQIATLELQPIETEHNAEIKGRVISVNTGEGEGDFNVRIYSPEEYLTLASDQDPATHIRDNQFVLPDDLFDESGGEKSWYVFDHNTDLTLVTDEEGLYSGTLTYPLLPDEENDTGSVRIVLNFTRQYFLLHDDDVVTGGTINLDGDTYTAEDGDIDDYYHFSDVIDADTTATIATIDVKRSEFSETLSGQVIEYNEAVAGDGAGVDPVDPDGNGQNGIRVNIYVDPDRNDDGAFDADFPGVADGAPTPTFSTKTELRTVTEQDVRDGYFTVNNITWEDDTYPGNQSSIVVWIEVEGKNVLSDNLDGQVGTGAADDPFLGVTTVFSGAENSIEVHFASIP